MIEIRDAVKKFDGFAALDGVTLTVPKGAVYGLVGPNGAGKSTLLRSLNGVYKVDSGAVTIEGESIWENPALKARVNSIPDDWYYFLQSSTQDMMKLYRGTYSTFSMERYKKLESAFPIDPKKPIRHLSKGMQKQAAFWLTMSCMPDYLLLDEPVDGLDPVSYTHLQSPPDSVPCPGDCVRLPGVGQKLAGIPRICGEQRRDRILDVYKRQLWS